MNGKRVLALIRRIARQIALDRRTIALVIFAPMLMLTLGAILFRAGVISRKVFTTCACD